jgi:periplasmic protein TonB
MILFFRRARVAVAIVSCIALSSAAPEMLQASSPQLKIYFAADFTDSAYQKKTYQRVASAWRRPSGTPKAGQKAVVIAVIRKDGTAPEATLHYPSGSDEWDAAALQAVKTAAPFDPLPKGYARPGVEVHFHFEYD